MADPSTWVVTIRVWSDRGRLRIRMLIGAPGAEEVVEFVGSSIEETCATLAEYLRERVC